MGHVLSCAFFGFLRVSEFTIPSKDSYNSSRHLSLQDVTVDNRTKSYLLQLFLKQSKTDPFEQGAQVYVGATDTTICPVKAVLSYRARRNSRPGPLFITKEGKGWTNSMFRSALQSLMGKLKLNRHHYNTHSFRIGAATSASLANISDTHIQMIGRWRSNAFQRYIRPPPTEVVKLSKVNCYWESVVQLNYTNSFLSLVYTYYGVTQVQTSNCMNVHNNHVNIIHVISCG